MGARLMAERLAIPMRVHNGRLAVIEQDSDEDVAQCLLAIGRTRRGDRWDQPDMGVDPLEFHERPVDLRQFAETLRRHEPRRTVDVIERTPALADAVSRAVADLEVTFGGD